MVYPDRIVDFAFCPYPCYQYLAVLADPEDWGPVNRILLNYIDFTYRRAAYLQERVDEAGGGKSFIVLDDDFACFNTGLFTPRFDAIYALFQPNNRPGGQPELALTICREDGFYSARTCLTLDMAYNNARQICRPMASWLAK